MCRLERQAEELRRLPFGSDLAPCLPVSQKMLNPLVNFLVHSFMHFPQQNQSFKVR